MKCFCYGHWTGGSLLFAFTYLQGDQKLLEERHDGWVVGFDVAKDIPIVEGLKHLPVGRDGLFKKLKVKGTVSIQCLVPREQ